MRSVAIIGTPIQIVLITAFAAALTYALGLPWTEHLWLLGLAFVMHRILDIFKPPPANWSQNLGGGLGIAADDIIASLYALGLMVPEQFVEMSEHVE